MSDFKLGDKIKVKKYLKKNSVVNWCVDCDKKGDDNKYHIESFEEEKEGIVVGQRNIHLKGCLMKMGYQEPAVYSPRKIITVYLVAYDMHRKLIKVPVDWDDVGDEIKDYSF